jgi:hypothetical protein
MFYNYVRLKDSFLNDLIKDMLYFFNYDNIYGLSMDYLKNKEVNKKGRSFLRTTCNFKRLISGLTGPVALYVQLPTCCSSQAAYLYF